MPRTSLRDARFHATLVQAYARLGVSNRHVLLAVSGGADSTALLVASAHIAPELQLKLSVASIDHGLRTESPDEVRRVEQLAGERGLPFLTARVNVGRRAGLEARARELRYAALEQLRRQAEADFIATAHTANDQAETLLMRLVRGAALAGAVGIHSQRGVLLRPMLELTRSEVETYLAVRGLSWVRDSLNEAPEFLRTRVRREVLPALERAAGHSVVERLSSFSAWAAEDEAHLSALADAAWERLRTAHGLDAVGVRALTPSLRRRVLVRLLREAAVAVDAATLRRVLGGLAATRPVTLSQGLQLRVAGGHVRVGHAKNTTARPLSAQPLRLHWGERTTEPNTGWTFQLGGSAERPDAVLALAHPVELPLQLRTRLPGERIATREGTRKLQDFLVDRRVPAEMRDMLPLVLDARGHVLWIPGHYRAPHTLEACGTCEEVLLYAWTPGAASAPAL